MMKNKKKIMIISSVLLVVIALLGTSYALFSLVVQGETTQVIKSGKLVLTLKDDLSKGVTITNGMPLTDSQGKNTEVYNFTLENTGNFPSTYTLSFEDVAVEDERMSDSVVKVYVTKGGTALSDPVILSSLTNREFDSGVLEIGESVDYTLQLWIDYSAGNDVQNTVFKAVVRADGTQIVE